MKPQTRELLNEFVKKGVRLKYRNSVLGIIWSLFEPLLSILVYVMVFGTIFNHRDLNFALYVSCGRLLYSFFSEGTKSACSSARANAEILRKVSVPQIVFPLSEILWHYVIFLISLVVLVPFFTNAVQGVHLVGGDPQDAGFSRRARAGDGPGAKPLPAADYARTRDNGDKCFCWNNLT